MDHMTDDTRTEDKQDDGSVIVVGPDGRPKDDITPSDRAAALVQEKKGKKPGKE